MSIYNDMQIGIVAHSCPWGHLPVTTTLRTNDSVCCKIESLHEEITFDKDTKLVLLVSCATDSDYSAHILHNDSHCPHYVIKYNIRDYVTAYDVPDDDLWIPMS